VDLDDPNYDHFAYGYELDGDLNPRLVEAMVAGAKVQEPAYFKDFPPNLAVDEKFLQRGRERYNIYCAVCHGRGGYGDGPVHNRIAQRQALTPSAIVGWVPPRNLHQPDMAAMPVGKLYDRITRGVFSVDPASGKKTYTMWPYAAQITPHDRWAIVAYIRVLQSSQFYPTATLPAELKSRVDPKAPAIKHPAVGPGVSTFKVTEAELDDPDLIAKGKTLFATKTCFTCHDTKDYGATGVSGQALKAPKYTGKFWGTEKRVHLGVNPNLTVKPEMATVIFGPEYFYESVKTPMAKIAEGSSPGMVLGVPVNDEEIKALMAFVRSQSDK
jgi:mono/diheme cytochrome c family protein